MAQTPHDRTQIPLKIALTYAIVGALWIVLTDQLVVAFIKDPATIALVSTYKGWFFVLVTAVILYVLINRNMTVIRGSERELEESESKYRSLVETTTDWVWEVNENTIYTYSGPQVYDILGYRPEEVIGKTPFDFMPEDEAQRIRDIFKGIADKYEAFRLLENTNLRKDGRPVVLETSGTPIFDKQNKFRGYRGIDRDITERRRAEQALQEKDRDIRSAYVDVFSAVTGGRLIIMTSDEIEASLGAPVMEPGAMRSYQDLSGARARLSEAFMPEFENNELLNELLLASSEALTNAVKHAGGGSYQVFRKGNTVQVMVSDNGPGIDFKILPKATLLSGFSTKQSLGVGFSIMLELCDRVLLATQIGSTGIILEKHLQRETEESSEFANLENILPFENIQPQ